MLSLGDQLCVLRFEKRRGQLVCVCGCAEDRRSFLDVAEARLGRLRLPEVTLVVVRALGRGKVLGVSVLLKAFLRVRLLEQVTVGRVEPHLKIVRLVEGREDLWEAFAF